MLLKNGKPYELSPAEINKLKKELSIPVRIKYPRRLLKKDPLAKNRTIGLVHQPSGIPLPLKAIVKTNKGTEEWISCLNFTKDKHGNIKPAPTRLEDFNGDMLLNEKDIDYIFFLFYKSPHCENGKNKSPKSSSHYFYFEQKEKEAALRTEIKRNKIDVDTLLWSPTDKGGMTLEEVKKFATSYGVRNADSFGDNELRELLEAKIIETVKDPSLKREDKGFHGFLLAYKYKGANEHRSIVTQAIDLNCIRHKSKSWWSMDENGVPDENILDRVSGNHVDALVSEVIKDEKLFEKIKSYVSDAKQKLEDKEE